MKKMMSICLMAWVLLGAFASLNAQTTIQRSLYVSARGNDNNNGRSEETPYKTLEKAAETANAGAIKTITVIGTIAGGSIRQSGADEILITGKPDASAAERAVISSSINISGKVRFSHILLTREMTGNSGPTITLGTGVVVSNTTGSGLINIGTLIMTDDATITGCSGAGVSGLQSYATVTMSGDTRITNNGGKGIEGAHDRSGNGTKVTMSGNAKVSGNKGRGVDCASLTMSGNTEISGNGNTATIRGYWNEGNGGVSITGLFMFGDVKIINTAGTQEGSSSSGGGVFVNALTMSGNAAIINNTSTGTGGGAYIYGAGTISGNARISDNTAKEGGGIYFSDATITMEGGEISGNKAENGAGVYVESGTFNHKGGSINNNEADYIGGGVYVKSGATYTAGGGRVTGNTSGDMGDDNVFRQ